MRNETRLLLRAALRILIDVEQQCSRDLTDKQQQRVHAAVRRVMLAMDDE